MSNNNKKVVNDYLDSLFDRVDPQPSEPIFTVDEPDDILPPIEVTREVRKWVENDSSSDASSVINLKIPEVGEISNLSSSMQEESEEEEGGIDDILRKLSVKKVDTSPSMSLSIRKLLESKPFMITMYIITIYALFFDDVKLLVFSSRADSYFDWITLCCIAAFTTEIILSCIALPEYLWRLPFWINLLSTLSMVIDLSIFTQLLQ